ncbi:MAG: UbiH/UbiF/VisC/COQ6 family ubiquinone biosynthesis hydroxylase [Thiotrichaceae bacterium]
MTSTIQHFDVIINGAGMVGATLACLLAQQGRKVAVIEAYLPTAFSEDAPAELRVSAISRASQRAFVEIGAWDQMLAMRASPYEAMHVWDGTGDGEIHFDAAELGEPNLGHIIENKVVQLALLEVMRDEEHIELIAPASLSTFEITDKRVSVELDNGSLLSSELLVGADGANSKVRSLAGITFNKNDYAQQGLVATVHTETSHQNTAWQRFLPGGPLALLPLFDGNCSIVWTLPADKADYHLAMTESDFNLALGEAFDFHLGDIKVISQRAAFPLMGRHAEHYVLPRIALIGDAAHTIHPLAGQGVNLGIKDAVELAKVLSNSSRSAGSYSLLRRYERARKGDNVLTQKAMEGFKVLFGNSFPIVKMGRNLGLNLVNKLAPIKNEIIRKAMGI